MINENLNQPHPMMPAILEKPLLLFSSSLLFAIRADCSNPDFPQNILAPSNHVRITEYQVKHPHAAERYAQGYVYYNG